MFLLLKACLQIVVQRFELWSVQDLRLRGSGLQGLGFGV